jgi:hypothetical protein
MQAMGHKNFFMKYLGIDCNINIDGHIAQFKTVGVAISTTPRHYND